MLNAQHSKGEVHDEEDAEEGDSEEQHHGVEDSVEEDTEEEDSGGGSWSLGQRCEREAVTIFFPFIYLQM